MMRSHIHTAFRRGCQLLMVQAGALYMIIASAWGAANDPTPGRSPAPPPAGAGADRMKDIRDIKPALDIGGDLRWLYWAAAAAGLLILAAVAWRLWRRQRAKQAPEAAAEPMPADAEAYRMLDALAAEGIADPKQFYFSLSAILRRYIERRFGVPASEMTTEELLPAVDRLALKAELAQPLKAFCRGADPVKFAGASAAQERMAGDLSFARDFVRRTTPTEATADDGETGESAPPILEAKGAETMAAEQRQRITN